MTDLEKINDAIATCIHQMIDVTVKVDDLDAAHEYVTDVLGYGQMDQPQHFGRNAFKLYPDGQVGSSMHRVCVESSRDNI